jgi:hypothetical protein
VTAREGIAWLRERAAGRREVRTLEASLAWIEHRNDDCQAILGELARISSEDSRPEREVGRHLNELFRFTEARAFLEHAVGLDPSDYEGARARRTSQHTGMEDEGLAALQKSEIAARGRQDAWRRNTIQVLERMRTEHVVEDLGELSFSWRPDEEEILRTYLVPFYARARSDLAARYGFTPGPTRIEVFRRFEDFSVRSVGFSGFPALGVCFGPVVTAVSPLSELRGTFSWARTSYHEFTHVIHLGLSHNRCPRWITEGLATWEEEQRNRSWTRNMRRDLLDARANGDLIPLRELNRAFRGPRILFAYYQGGLLCEMLVGEFGFPPIVRLLEAFDRGLDLDQAFAENFSLTSEEVDQRFRSSSTERSPVSCSSRAGRRRSSRACGSPCRDSRLRTPRRARNGPRTSALSRGGATRQGDRSTRRKRCDASTQRESTRSERGSCAESSRSPRNNATRRTTSGRNAWTREARTSEVSSDWARCAWTGTNGPMPSARSSRRSTPSPAMRRKASPPSCASSSSIESARIPIARGKRWNAGSTGIPASSRSASMSLPGTPRPVATGRRNGVSRRRTRSIRSGGLHRDWGAALQALDRASRRRLASSTSLHRATAIRGEQSLAARALAMEVALDETLSSLRHRHPLTWTPEEIARLSDGQRQTLQALRIGDACERAELCRREADCLDRLGRAEEAGAARTEAESLDAVCNQGTR